jgi:hypothetical protein
MPIQNKFEKKNTNNVIRYSTLAGDREKNRESHDYRGLVGSPA